MEKANENVYCNFHPLNSECACCGVGIDDLIVLEDAVDLEPETLQTIFDSTIPVIAHRKPRRIFKNK